MGSRLKEDEKNEKAIRSLLRKTPNRRCINCNSLGPQYVCLNFWTFVCTQCSGIHREFTHRVKSVSMSKFTSQEVANLEAGGNERGREIHFKDWDSQRQPLPDSSNVDRLREFIKMVYVDKRFSGERPLPRARGGDREETYNSRRPEPRPNYRADSRSPPFEDRYDERPSGGRRSNAGYDDRRPDERGTRFDEKRSPGRFERRSPGRFDSDRNRYDRNYNDGHRYDERPRYETRDRQQYEDRYSEGLDRRFEDRFANERGSRGYGGSSPPPVRPVKEILGEEVPPLRVENHESQTNGGREADKSHSSQDGRGQRFGSSSSFGSVDGNVPAVAPVKKEDSTSLIDFSVEPDPPAPAAKEQADPFGLTAAVQPSADASNSTGWATFGSAAPASSLGDLVQAPSAASAQGILGGLTNPTDVINGNSQWATQWTATPGPSAVDAGASSWSSLVGPSVPATSSQPWNAFSANSSEANALPAPQMSIPHDPQSVNSSAGAATQATLTQQPGRSEILEDFFGGSFSSQFAGGQSFGLQYSSMGGRMGMQPGNYSQPQKSKNPFDLPGDSSAGPVAGEFPSLTPIQTALPTLNMGPRPAPGPGLSAYGSQWSQSNAMSPPQALYSSGSVPTGSGLFPGQQLQTVPPQIMQGSMGPPLGGNVSGSFFNGPKQAAESFFTAPGFQQLPSQNSFGQHLPSQNSFSQHMTPQNSFGQHLPSQNSFGQHLPSQNSFGQHLPS
eukprot:c16100_g1_i3 orf=348-2534(+)